MDKITLKNMKFYAYHGVLPEEEQNGQYFFVDVEMFCPLRDAGRTDNLEKTVDYSAVYGMVKTVVLGNKFRLIESLADSISREIMTAYTQIMDIVVRVRKPEAPIEGQLDWAEVQVERSRDDF